jgi:hypothetical protein
MIKNAGYLQELIRATGFLGFTTKQDDAIKYNYYDAVSLAYNLNKRNNAVDYAVMVEVA